MTAPLDPDVEAAIREVTFASHDVGLFASDKYVRAEIECLDTLREAIRTACVAAERRGIERAAAVAEQYGDDSPDDQGAGACYRLRELLLALPVPESTEAP